MPEIWGENKKEQQKELPDLANPEKLKDSAGRSSAREPREGVELVEHSLVCEVLSLMWKKNIRWGPILVRYTVQLSRQMQISEMFSGMWSFKLGLTLREGIYQ